MKVWSELGHFVPTLQTTHFILCLLGTLGAQLFHLSSLFTRMDDCQRWHLVGDHVFGRLLHHSPSRSGLEQTFQEGKEEGKPQQGLLSLLSTRKRSKRSKSRASDWDETNSHSSTTHGGGGGETSKILPRAHYQVG